MSPKKILRHIFKFHGFSESLKTASKGILYLFLYHRNMRIIFMLGVCAFLTGIYFELKGIQMAALCVTITLVFMAEIFNTAIEMMMDMLTIKYRTRIKLVKDIAAGVVILASLNAVAVGVILFGPKLYSKIKKFTDIKICYAQSAPSAASIERSQELINEEAGLRQRIEDGERVYIKKITIKNAGSLSDIEIHDLVSLYENTWMDSRQIQQLSESVKRRCIDDGELADPLNIDYNIDEDGNLTLTVAMGED